MRDVTSATTIVLLILTCGAVHADEVDDLLEEIVTASSAGFENIDDQTRISKTMGTTTFEFYEKAPPFEVDGMTIHSLQMVPFSEIQRRHNAAQGLESPSATEMAAAADQIEMVGVEMEREMTSQMQTTGMPGMMGPMLMNPPPDQPWLSANPRDMTSMYADMLRAAAEGEEEMAAERAAMPAEQARSIREMREKMRINGSREFNGRSVTDVIASDLNSIQGDTTCQSMQMFIDDEWKIPLYFKMDCTVTEGGEVQQISIERESHDVRTVPSCGDYREPFRNVMRIGGVMTPEQQAQMAEARVQLEEFEKQFASMPPEQKKMMESMMGPQLEMIRNMASGSGAIEFVQETVELRCNTGLPDPAEISQVMMGGMVTSTAVPAAPVRDNLLQMIQIDLEKLDYEPGNTRGEMDKGTAVAISRFQAENGIEVTGQPSPQLAGILQAAVDGMAPADLTEEYLAGFWCTERTQERELYNFAADGSYRLGIVGITITQMDGINYLPQTFTHQSFLDKFSSVVTRNDNQFSAMLNNGSRETFLRGNCFE